MRDLNSAAGRLAFVGFSASHDDDSTSASIYTSSFSAPAKACLVFRPGRQLHLVDAMAAKGIVFGERISAAQLFPSDPLY
ncbi:hypothetical protein [Rhizobium rhizogenes]|uniref:hypothetical protein n=1 Tax=Rhizobium rhizogenes TaxID=359 RepID=UPI00115C4D04|nr:hypothetical protein [Rhizobium rhizogenes]TRB39343.1 hypothetical protein EXN73_25005 [Rhizobium rhizogenes]